MPDSTEHPSARHGRESVGELVEQASEQFSRLIRQELRLAQAEMRQKGRRFGIGGGLFGGAGVIGFLALQALVAASIAALALVLPVWASALIITAVLLAVAAVLAATGRKQVGQGTPAAPEQAIEGLKADAAEIKERMTHR
ncbi:phage holin family protein [Streptomyces sp. NPDC127084]|uniref:phage holin family protein n=1 Tax=Streptomyces sp. NPDC127084 TaxID=3347133 RepID=UPI0036494AC0